MPGRSRARRRVAREGGRLDVSAAPAQDALGQAVPSGRGAGRASDQVGRAVAAKSSQARLVAVFRSRVYFPDGATVHPGCSSRALRRNGDRRQASAVHERTLRSVSATSVETRGGVLRAPEIVLATNAALTGWRLLRGA